MIRMSVLYPTTDGATFDHDYYRDRHVPLCGATWHPERVEIDRGVDGPYVAAVHLFFPTLEAMQGAMTADGTAAVLADVANYTTISPVLQVSEVV
ncbi:MAG: EthD family reductase [Acidimicrobiales bacterium]